MPISENLWSRQFGTVSADFAYAVSASSSNHLYVVGRTDGILGASSAGSQDIFLSKYDQNGSVLWNQQIGGSGWDQAFAVTTDSSGSVYVAGETRSVDLDGQSSYGGWDIAVVKYDSNGNKLWTKRFGSSNDDGASSLAIGDDGFLYVAGYTYGDLPGQGQVANTGYDSGYISQLSTDNGDIQWTQLVQSNVNDRIRKIIYHQSGQIFFVGTTNGTMIGPNGPIQNNGFLTSFFGSLQASNRELQWLQVPTGDSRRDLYDLASDNIGNIYITGRSNVSTIDGNASSGSYDGIVSKYSADSGQLLWTRLIGSSGSDLAKSIAIAQNGVIAVTGSVSSWPNDPLNPFLGGVWDGFLALYASNGDRKRFTVFGGSGDDEPSQIVSAGAKGYISGVTSDSFSGQSSIGSLDAFVTAYNLTTNSPPASIVLSRQELSEGATGEADRSIDISTVDPDQQDMHTYSLVSGDGDYDNNKFIISGRKLILGAAPDYEQKTMYTTRIRSTDLAGESVEASFQINIQDVNEAPYQLFVDRYNFPGGVPLGTRVATIITNDPDAGDTHTYALAPGELDNSLFRIDGDGIYTAARFSTQRSVGYRLNIISYDSGGKSVAGVVSLTALRENQVGNVDDKPSNLPSSKDGSVGDPISPPNNSTTSTIQSLANVSSVQYRDSIYKALLQQPFTIGSQLIEEVLIGTSKDDRLFGTEKSEIFASGPGRDIITGGPGTDVFLLNPSDGLGRKARDVIKDFSEKDNDRLAIPGELLNRRSKNFFSVVSSKAAAKDAALSRALFVYDDSNGSLYFNQNGRRLGWGDGGHLVRLNGAPELTNSSFEFV